MRLKSGHQALAKELKQMAGICDQAIHLIETEEGLAVFDKMSEFYWEVFQDTNYYGAEEITERYISKRNEITT